VLRSHSRPCLFLILVLALGAPLSMSYAQTRADSCIFIISGEIAPLLIGVVKKQYAGLNHGKPESCAQVVVQLDSPGGDVVSAIEIGQFLRQKEIWTIVPTKATCASACVLAFLGGVRRMDSPGRIGIHRPYGAGLSSSINESKGTFTKINQSVKKYLDDINISESLLTAMNSVPPGEIRWLDREQLVALQIVGSDPVWEDVSDSKLAKRLGISKRELYERQSRASDLCSYSRLRDSLEMVRCSWAIINPTNR